MVIAKQQIFLKICCKNVAKLAETHKKTRHLHIENALLIVWAVLDSNQRPLACQASTVFFIDIFSLHGAT